MHKRNGFLKALLMQDVLGLPEGKGWHGSFGELGEFIFERCDLVGKVLDMSSTCRKVGQMSENFETDVAVYDTSHRRFLVCRAYQMMTRRKKKSAFFIFYCIFEFFGTRRVHRTKKKEKSMLGSTFFLP